MTLDGAKVSGRSVALQATTAILDSGTTAILVSAADAAVIHSVRLHPSTRFRERPESYSFCKHVHAQAALLSSPSCLL